MEVNVTLQSDYTFGACMAEKLEVPFGTMPPFFHEFVNAMPESSFGLCCHLSRISFAFL